MSPLEPLTIAPKNLPTLVGALLRRGGRPRFAYAWRNVAERIELRYVASEPGDKGLSGAARRTAPFPASPTSVLRSVGTSVR